MQSLIGEYAIQQQKEESQFAVSLRWITFSHLSLTGWLHAAISYRVGAMLYSTQWELTWISNEISLLPTAIYFVFLLAFNWPWSVHLYTYGCIFATDIHWILEKRDAGLWVFLKRRICNRWTLVVSSVELGFICSDGQEDRNILWSKWLSHRL